MQAIALLCLSTGLLFACGGPRHSVRPGPAVQSAPAWTRLPEGWKRLEAIETWIEKRGTVASSFWRVEGRLELAEGRITQAFKDLGRSPEPEREASLLTRRVQAAEQDLRLVQNSAAANPRQLERADEALARASRFRDRLARQPILEPFREAPGADAPSLTMAVVPRSSWRASAPRRSNLTLADGRWERITVHHSAEAHPPKLDGSLRASVNAVRNIQRAHVLGSGYGDIGYHYLIDPSGRVFEGRPLTWRGAHAAGVNNRRNLGVCVLGNFEKQMPTPAALQSLEQLLAELRRVHGISSSKVLEHKHFKNTLCPGKHLSRWLAARRGPGGRTSASRTSPTNVAGDGLGLAP